MSDRDSDHMLLELQEARAEIDRLRDLTRWRKWPEEKPTGMMPFWLVSDGSNVDIEWIWHERESVLEQSAKWWRPIGPLPGEGGE